MNILTEIAQRIDKALDGDCGYGVGKCLAEQIAPLITEHDAQVRAEALRGAAQIAEEYPAGSVQGRIVRMQIAARIEREAGL